MDTDELLAAYDRQVRGATSPGDVVREDGGPEGWRGVLWADLDDADADAAIAAQVRHFAARGGDFEWKLHGHDRPADLGARLRAAGFTAGPVETLMVAETARLSPRVDLPAGLELRPVTDPTGVDLAADVHERVFGDDDGRLRRHLHERLAAGDGTVEVVVVMAGGTPVSSSRIEWRPGTDFAGLWGGGTLPEWRGRGLYRAQVAHRARLAAARGVRHLQVDASDDSRPVLLRLGFTPLTTTTPYTYTYASTGGRPDERATQ